MIELNFLFWLFLFGLIVAGLQDLKRREVDNWLNLFLIFSSFVFVIYGAVLSGDNSVFFQGAFLLLIMYFVSNAFYHGKVFAGGDAKLLFAMCVFFVGENFSVTLFNLGFFLVLLMISGSVYGLIYSLGIYFNNFKKTNREMKKYYTPKLKLFFLLGFVFFFGGFFSYIFFLFSLLSFLFPVLFVFAKSLEEVAMIRNVSGKELREGDWLVRDVRIGNKIIKATFEGISKEEINLLHSRKKVLIKDGLPFVPAFLIAFLLYVFSRNFLFSLVGIN